MGVEKTENTNKVYAAGYADGFAAGIAAGFAATQELPPTQGASSLTEAGHDTAMAAPNMENHAIENAEFSTEGEDAHQTGNPSEAPSTTGLSQEDLAHLAPGCFVQVDQGDSAYWVEVGQIEGSTISGMVHPELSSSVCVINHDSCEIARFSRDQITALGCDRYCWC